MKRVTDLQYWMDGLLKEHLDDCLYNIRNDFDFVFIISGDGMVRMGKSVLAQQIGYYAACELQTPFNIDNIVFSGAELMSLAKRLPKNSVIVYDEARGELDSKKSMENISRTLQDFFAECGMYNHFIILVMPDYFELNKSIAVNRSHALLNVYMKKKKMLRKDGSYRVKFDRGYFEYFSRRSKKKLYILGKKQFHDYRVVKPDFFGEFRSFDVIDKDLYHMKKLAYVRRERLSKETKPVSSDKTRMYFLRLVEALQADTSKNVPGELIAKYCGISRSGLVKLLRKLRNEKYPTSGDSEMDLYSESDKNIGGVSE